MTRFWHERRGDVTTNIKNMADKLFFTTAADVRRDMEMKASASKLNAETIIDLLHEEKPRFIWEMDKDTFDKIKGLKDGEGKYLWVPEIDYLKHNGRLVGLDITISDEPGIRLVTIFRKSEHSKLVVMEG